MGQDRKTILRQEKQTLAPELPNYPPHKKPWVYLLFLPATRLHQVQNPLPQKTPLPKPYRFPLLEYRNSLIVSLHLGTSTNDGEQKMEISTTSPKYEPKTCLGAIGSSEFFEEYWEKKQVLA
jgi:hypothetical protein